MTRTRPVLGAVLATVLAVSGCGLGGTASPGPANTTRIPELAPGQQVSIVFESYNYGMAGAWTDTFDALLAEFGERYPNITVTARKPQGNSPNPATDTISSIQNQLVAGAPPDVAQLGFSDLDFTVRQLGAAPLDLLVGRDEVDRAFDGARHPYAPRARTLDDWDGHTYGMPFVFSTPVLYFNASLFTAAGLDPERPPTTWAEAATAAARIAERTGRGGIYLDCLTKSAMDWCFQSLVRSNGGRVISPDRRTLTYAEDPAVEVTRMARDLVTSGAMPVLNQKQGYEAFARGEESYTRIARDIGYLPLRTGLLGEPGALAEWAAADPLLAPNVAQLATMEPWVSMPGDNYLQVRDGMMEAVEAIVFQGSDPRSTLAAAQAAGTALLPAS
ncbi:extracellular solute-binding protein [Nocardia sp. SSK8]|uniref:extracellular solute-binding protein n=1 Tax=Nocardia sp. SSK8 TaxID=3120154 RepID=UPI00300965FF